MTAAARPTPPLSPSDLHAHRVVPLEGGPLDRAIVRRLVAAAFRAGAYSARRIELATAAESSS